jgi:Pyridoxamine 5'-phosphate oxidase
VTPHQARRRFAAARVARLATADAAGRPHIVPVTFAVDGDVVYSAVDAKPKRGTALKRLANVAANPAVALLVDHTRTTGTNCGGYAPTALAAWSTRRTPRAYAPCRCSPTATRASPRAGPCSPSTYTAGQAGRRRPRPRKAEMALLPIDRGPPRADCSACARQRTAASKTICTGPISRLAVGSTLMTSGPSTGRTSIIGRSESVMIKSLPPLREC